jgi:hypothetical protein
VEKVRTFAQEWRKKTAAQIRELAQSGDQIPTDLDVVAVLENRGFVSSLTLADLDILTVAASATGLELRQTLAGLVDRYQTSMRRQVGVINAVMESYAPDRENLRLIRELVSEFELGHIDANGVTERLVDIFQEE